MQGQLYFEFKNCLLPRPGRVVPKLRRSYALMTWPNGKPCALINFWLNDIAKRTTGQTVKQYCVNITPLVRFAYKRKIDLLNFNDGDLVELSIKLTAERRPNGERKKQNNQVNAVVDTILLFYIWLRDVGNPREYGHLVGEEGSVPNLTVKLTVGAFGRRVHMHEAHVEHNADLHEKTAMPQSSITAIEDQIFIESTLGSETLPSVHRQNSDSDRSKAVKAYLFERRSFSLWMFLRTGLRPSELCLMPWHLNCRVIDSNLLYLPTEKRRTDNLALRVFKITLDDSLSVNYYLEARAKFIYSLQQLGLFNEAGHTMLLTESGTDLAVGSLTRDFSRLVQRAGLSNVRACLSMFRHRFITKEIIIHLKETFGKKLPTRAMLSPPVIKSLEERIRKKTGHGLGESIWTYFDTAFNMLKIWENVDIALNNFNRVDVLEDKVRRLRYRVINSSDDSVILSEQVRKLHEELFQLRSQMGYNG